MLLNNYTLEEKIFIDANIFIFNALDDPKFGGNAASFLEKVEKGRIKDVITPIVMDEIFFKLLVAEASKHMEKVGIWALRKRVKTDGEFRRIVYSPVKEYKEYLLDLSLRGLEIIEIDGSMALDSVNWGERYGLLTSDSMHVATMKAGGIKNIATEDDDFERVEGIEVWGLGSI